MKKQMLFLAVPGASHRPRCQGRAVCVHRSEAESLDREAGGEAQSFRREEQYEIS